MAFDGTSRTVLLTRTVQVELAKPLDASWDVVGSRLRVLRSQMHRLLNAGIVGLVANRYFDEPYRALEFIKDEIAEIEAWAAEHNAAHLQQLEMPSGVTDACQRRCQQMVDQWRKAKGDKRIPSFKRGAPIFIRDGRWQLKQAERGFGFATRLWADRKTPVFERMPWTRFAVVPSKGWHYSLLKRLATDPTVKLGNCQLVYDEHRKKWYAKLAFTAHEPLPEQGRKDIALALNRGRHCFLYAASNMAGKHRALMDGRDVLAVKQGFAARRSSMKAHMRTPGHGARGHGKGRWHESYRALEDAEARYIHTTCQQVAAAAIRFALAIGAATILIEDFNTIVAEDSRFIDRWPWYQLKQAVTWAAKKAGIEVVEVPSEYISSACPRCGNLDPSQHNTRTGMFHCAKCAFVRSADLVATLNMLDHSDFDIGGWQKNFKQEQEFVQSIRSEQTAGLLQSPHASGPDKGGGQLPREPHTTRKPRRRGTK
jgi:IS605 OrfB family transposase